MFYDCFCTLKFHPEPVLEFKECLFDIDMSEMMCFVFSHWRRTSAFPLPFLPSFGRSSLAGSSLLGMKRKRRMTRASPSKMERERKALRRLKKELELRNFRSQMQKRNQSEEGRLIKTRKTIRKRRQARMRQLLAHRGAKERQKLTRRMHQRKQS